VRVACATRLSEKEFWKASALGRSLRNWRQDRRVSFDVAYGNTAGLPVVYNAALDRSAPGEAVVFVHDDVWLEDPLWLDKLTPALRRFDLVGVAGNTRRQKRQRAWLIRPGDGFVLDLPHLSGVVGHGERPGGEASEYGPTPAACELLDGVLLALRAEVARGSGLRFDERFRFHFYDLDLCREARRRGLVLGTWPISLTHQSKGFFGGEAWEAGLAQYFGKWGG
jgi:GT2 family glycosyltransferase